METFNTSESEQRYVAWLEANATGFVVNCARPNPKPNYLVLHRTTCWSISKDPRGDGRWTGRGYQKVCSDDRPSLERWAIREVGGELRPCGLCMP